MKLVVVADVHDLAGFANLYRAVDFERPDVVLSCGDWGSNLPTQRKHVLAHYSPEFLKLTPGAYEELFTPILEKTRLISLYGNHDILDVLYGLKNKDGSNCWLPSFEKKLIDGLTIVGINGNVSGKGNPWNVTLTELRAQYAKHRPVSPIDIVLSHEAVAPHQYKGHAALTEFFNMLQPRFWFTGHIHKESDVTVDGVRLIGLGMMLHGVYSTLDIESGELERKVLK